MEQIVTILGKSTISIIAQIFPKQILSLMGKLKGCQNCWARHMGK